MKVRNPNKAKNQASKHKQSLLKRAQHFLAKRSRMFAPKQLYLKWLEATIGNSKYKPHQGAQECARRVQQRRKGFI